MSGTGVAHEELPLGDDADAHGRVTKHTIALDEDWADMVDMPSLSADLVNANIGQRFMRDRIYTNVSNILMSVNPYQLIPGLYDVGMLDTHHFLNNETDADRLEPHIFGFARRVFKGASGTGTKSRMNQSIMISGESGAGKTEATKLCLRYIVEMCSRLVAVYNRQGAKAAEAATRQGVLERALSNQGAPELIYGEADSLEEKIMSANPLLEAFGNAKTHRNDNSSRFGKWIQLELDERNLLVNGTITKYLLEESRVCTQAKGERNFNIFYQVCLGSSSGPEGELLPEHFHYLNQSRCTKVAGVYDGTDFTNMVEAFRCLGVGQEKRLQIFAAIKGILYLGNVSFEMKQVGKREELGVTKDSALALRQAVALLMFGRDLDQAEELTVADVTRKEEQAPKKRMRHVDVTPDDVAISEDPPIERADEGDEAPAAAAAAAEEEEKRPAKPLDQAVAALQRVLLYNVVFAGTVRGSIIAKPRTQKDAEGVRDSVAKRLYSSLFDYIVLLINQALTTSISPNPDKPPTTIGILDIFGFENFEQNSFEQLCINYANEKLQNHFLHVLQNEEMELYRDEGIRIDEMEFRDNSACLALLEARPQGVFAIISDELSLPKATDLALLDQMHKVLAPAYPTTYEKPRKGNFPEFVIHHYAEPVTYLISGFLDKCRSKISDHVLEPFRRHGVSVVTDALALQDQGLLDADQDGRKPNVSKSVVRSTRSSSRSLARLTRQASVTGQNITGGTAGGTGEMFKNSLRLLLASIQNTESHFIRCVKPNEEKLPHVYTSDLAARQLVSSGVLAAVTIRQLGYPERRTYKQFVQGYGLLFHKSSIKPPPADLLAEYRAQNPRDVAGQRRLAQLIMIQADLANDRPVDQQMQIYQMGKTRVFFKHSVYIRLEDRREELRGRFAVVLQCLTRQYLARAALRARRQAWAALENTVQVGNWNELDHAIAGCLAAGMSNKKLQPFREIKNRQQYLWRAESRLFAALNCTDPVLDACVSLLHEAADEADLTICQHKLPGYDQAVLDDAAVRAAHPLKIMCVVAQKLCPLLTKLVDDLKALRQAALVACPPEEQLTAAPLRATLSAHNATLSDLATKRAGVAGGAFLTTLFATPDPLAHLAQASEVVTCSALLATIRQAHLSVEDLVEKKDLEGLAVLVQLVKDEGLTLTPSLARAGVCLEALQLQERVEKAAARSSREKISAMLALLKGMSAEQRASFAPFLRDATFEALTTRLEARLAALQEKEAKVSLKFAAAAASDMQSLNSKFEGDKNANILSGLFAKRTLSEQVALALEGCEDAAEEVVTVRNAIQLAEQAHLDTAQLQVKLAQAQLREKLQEGLSQGRGPLHALVTETLQQKAKEEVPWTPQLETALVKANSRLALLRKTGHEGGAVERVDEARPVALHESDDEEDAGAGSVGLAGQSARGHVRNHTTTVSPRSDLLQGPTSFLAEARDPARAFMDGVVDPHDPAEIERRKQVLADALARLRPLARETKIFGGTLADGVMCSPYRVPLVMFDTVKFLRANAMGHQGLFRIPGAATEVDKFKACYELQEPVELHDNDCVAGLLKLFLRELSEPLIPYTHYDHMLEVAEFAKQEPDKLESVLEKYRILLGSMPALERCLLQFLIEFLRDVDRNSSVNKMTAKNLAIVFAPNLLQHRGTDMSRTVKDIDKCILCVTLLIDHCTALFPNANGVETELYRERTAEETGGSDERQPGRGRLHVVVHGASNLPLVGLARPDPYVNLVCNGKKKRSKVVKKSVHPEFEQGFSFDVDNPLEALLKLNVKSKAKGKSVLLGRAVFTVGQVARFCMQAKNNKGAGKKIHKVWPLQNAIHGEIDCTLYYEELNTPTSPINSPARGFGAFRSFGQTKAQLFKP